MRLSLILALLVSILIGCGEDAAVPDSGTPLPDSGTDAVADIGTTEDAVDATSDGGADAAVDLDSIDKTPDPACTATWTVGGRGMAVFADGSPALGARVQMCLRVGENLLCLAPQLVDDTGAYEVIFPEEARCISEMTYRSFVAGERVATTYCVSDLAVTDAILEREEPLVLRRTGPALELPPEGDTMEIRTVTLADGFEMDLSPSQLLGTYERLGVAAVDGPSCTTANAPEFASVYAFSPEVSLFEGSIPLRLPNTTGLPAGTAVELMVVGGLGTKTPGGEEIVEGIWAPVGSGVVDESGTQIGGEMATTTALTWLGVRAVVR